MSRVDELQRRYPSLTRQYIVRWDARVHGLRDNGELDEFGQWVRVEPKGSYATYDFDITLKDWVAARPGRQKPGSVLRPGRFVLPENGLELGYRGLVINTKSDLEVKCEGGGRFALCQGHERVEEVWHQPTLTTGGKMTSTGKPEANFLTRRSKHCFGIYPVRHCEYFPLGLACRFCNFNSTHEDARAIGLERSTTVDPEETLEAYKMFASERRIVEGCFQMGAFAKSESEVRIHADFMQRMALATPYKPNFVTSCQPMSRKNLQRLKDVGLDSAGCNMEIWDPNLFAEVVPGKSQYRGRDRYLEALQEAVDVLGPGNVRTALVGGLGMIPEKGHRTWQEDRDSLIEGFNWLIKRSILPIVPYLRLPPGAAYGNDENRKKMPPTEYYLELSIAHHEACKEYGLYDKLNRLMNCPLDCFAITVGDGELGAYELAGSLANWAAPVLPREANWFRDWEEQHKPLAKTPEENGK